MLRLRQEREQRGWSLTQVTQKTGISEPVLSALERGKIPAYPGWQKRIAKAFRMSRHALFQEVVDDDKR